MKTSILIALGAVTVLATPAQAQLGSELAVTFAPNYRSFSLDESLAASSVSLLLLPDLNRDTLGEWLAAPSGAVPMILFVILAFQHSVDGLKVVIDDYVHDEANRLLVTGLLYFAAIGAGALALFSLAAIAFGA